MGGEDGCDVAEEWVSQGGCKPLKWMLVEEEFDGERVTKGDQVGGADVEDTVVCVVVHHIES